LAEVLLKLVPTRSAYTGYVGSLSVICHHYYVQCYILANDCSLVWWLVIIF